MSSEEPFKDLIVSNVLKPLFDTVSEKPFKIPSIGKQTINLFNFYYIL